MNTKELNAIIANAKNAYKNGVKSPIKLMNIMNGQAFKNDPALKEALKALGATRWTLDLAPHTLTGAICKIGKAVPADYIFEEEGKAYCFIAGKLYFATVIDTFKGEEFLTICRQKKAAELKKEEKAEKAAQKEAKKAQTAADRKKKNAEKKREKKTAPQRELLQSLFDAGLLTEEQYSERLAILDAAA